MTTEMFLLTCKQAGLQIWELDEMTIGMAIDFIEEYIAFHNPKNKKRPARRATQADFDAF